MVSPTELYTRLYAAIGAHFFLYVLNLSKGYINKIINYSDDRLPTFLAKEAVRRKSGWWAEWKGLGDKHGIKLKLTEETQLAIRNGYGYK